MFDTNQFLKLSRYLKILKKHSLLNSVYFNYDLLAVIVNTI
jgi:hypothetical protein